MHAECTHATISVGAVFCLRTRLVYVRPDVIPTEQGRKIRGDDLDVFARRCRQFHKILRGIEVNGYVLLNPKWPLPRGLVNYTHVIDLFRHLDELKKKGESE